MKRLQSLLLIASLLSASGTPACKQSLQLEPSALPEALSAKQAYPYAKIHAMDAKGRNVEAQGTTDELNFFIEGQESAFLSKDWDEIAITPASEGNIAVFQEESLWAIPWPSLGRPYERLPSDVVYLRAPEETSLVYWENHKVTMLPVSKIRRIEVPYHTVSPMKIAGWSMIGSSSIPIVLSVLLIQAGEDLNRPSTPEQDPSDNAANGFVGTIAILGGGLVGLIGLGLLGTGIGLTTWSYTIPGTSTKPLEEKTSGVSIRFGPGGIAGEF